MKQAWNKYALIALIAISLPAARGGVIDSSDVVIGSTTYRTFIDDATGYTWLDLDNFFGSSKSYNDIVSDLAGSNFHIATTSEITTLHSSIVGSYGSFPTESPIVGGSPTRDLFWGLYDDGDPAGGAGYSYIYAISEWDTIPDQFAVTAPLSTYDDLGVWVLSTTIPEPTSIAMISVAGILFLTIRRLL